MSYDKSKMISLGDIQVDLEAETCTKNGARLNLSPLSFKLLACLIEHDGEAVSSELLKEKVWQGIAVTDDGLKQRVRILRKALGDDGETPKIIGAERHKGYKLLISPKPLNTSNPILIKGLALSFIVIAIIFSSFFWEDKKSIRLVVMPFETEDVDQQSLLFTRGLTYELISRINSMPVLSTVNLTSAGLYADKRARDVAKEFNADAIIEGSVLRQEGYLKVNVQMTDGESEEVIWSSIYEKSMPDIFEIQRDITFHIALVLNQDFDRSTAEHLKIFPTENIEAYSLFIQALGYEGQMHDEAVNLLERAIDLDPEFKEAEDLLIKINDN
ncbi:winged helix-turn-helix domain-containing protein [Pseudemcibacter aquimaris]|uniref:winged helix-turn-helix domain-containing protein n=1 Tax=Pseudemcibacter aquimaris TaxID=2857064 RepID=UPI0020122127|nr:winged helix-turn-helix domain-containing protein [Pseudemcibacter aquimaris]MCC3859935.1 winged helix-turn-helix domain-containing protein [Pseudemcibacter aquimaris]WDU57267.1 winged helix-turn-helix domain-containing protein [Pseudemcibacter aquimaris]